MFHVSCFRKRAFTLMELLIYSAILAISAGAIGSIFYTVSKANLKTQAENEVNNQMARLEEIFRQKIEAAKGVNTISGSLLELNMGNSTSTFSLGTNDSTTTVYLLEAGSSMALNDPSKVKVTSLTFTPTGASGTAISNSYHYAWNDQVGWIDFAYSGGNVRVPIGLGDLNGGAYILSDGSWISLNCAYTDSCSPTGFDYKVSSDENGNLSGWAWSENYGWISFASTTPPVHGVTVATSTGEFNGYAGSENIGWISFNCKTGGDESEDPFEKDICDTSDYKVQDLRMNTSAIKVEITLQYNSPKPELVSTSTNSFVFNILTPTK